MFKYLRHKRPNRGHVAEALLFTRLQLGIENPQPVSERVLIKDAVEIFEQKGQRLPLIQTGVMGESPQAAIAVLGHRGIEPAGEAEAFGH